MPDKNVAVDLVSDPGSAVLFNLTGHLNSVSANRPGASPHALIAQGTRMIAAFRRRDHVQWAVQAQAAAIFWEVASRFQPHLVEQERLAREAFKANRVRRVRLHRRG